MALGVIWLWWHHHEMTCSDVIIYDDIIVATLNNYNGAKKIEEEIWLATDIFYVCYSHMVYLSCTQIVSLIMLYLIIIMKPKHLENKFDWLLISFKFVILTWCICYSLMHSDCLLYHAIYAISKNKLSAKNQTSFISFKSTHSPSFHLEWTWTLSLFFSLEQLALCNLLQLTFAVKESSTIFCCNLSWLPVTDIKGWGLLGWRNAVESIWERKD